MADSTETTERTRLFLYVATVLLVTGYFGQISEFCSVANCSTRINCVIAFGVLTVLFSIGAATVVLLSLPRAVELVLAVLALVFNSAGAAILTSYKTSLSSQILSNLQTLPAILAWASELMLLAASFLSFGSAPISLPSKMPPGFAATTAAVGGAAGAPLQYAPVATQPAPVPASVAVPMGIPVPHGA